MGFDDTLGIWSHNKADLAAAYEAGWLTNGGDGALGWLDASNLHTTEENECPDECGVSNTIFAYRAAVSEASVSYSFGSHARYLPNLHCDGTVRSAMRDGVRLRRSRRYPKADSVVAQSSGLVALETGPLLRCGVECPHASRCRIADKSSSGRRSRIRV